MIILVIILAINYQDAKVTEEKKLNVFLERKAK